MKLNRKGYMLVEIVVASVLAMSIGYYLLEMTYQFKDVNEDLYHSIIYTTKKNVITKNIMNDLGNSMVVGIERCSSTCLDIKIKRESGEDITKRLRLDDKKIEYGIYSNGTYDKDDISYYINELDDFLVIGDFVYESSGGKFWSILIPINSLYGDVDYDVKLFVVRYSE